MDFFLALATRARMFVTSRVPFFPNRHAAYVNAYLINCRIFIHFLVRLAFRPSGGAPNGPELATTIASSSTTLAPTPVSQRVAFIKRVTATHVIQ